MKPYSYSESLSVSVGQRTIRKIIYIFHEYPIFFNLIMRCINTYWSLYGKNHRVSAARFLLEKTLNAKERVKITRYLSADQIRG